MKNIGKNIIAATAIITATAGTTTAAEPDHKATQAEITDMVLDELQQRNSRAKAYYRDVQAAEGAAIDRLSGGGPSSIKPKDSTIKEDMEAAEIPIKYDNSIDRNRAPGFIQMFIDAWDFITGWI